MKNTVLLALGVSLIVGGVAAAEGTRHLENGFWVEKHGNTLLKYPQKNVVDFSGTEVTGAATRPLGLPISSTPLAKSKSVVRVRPDFDAEVIDSSRSLF
jgi:hypothetical protein